jgi:hypothetical protein
MKLAQSRTFSPSKMPFSIVASLRNVCCCYFGGWNIARALNPLFDPCLPGHATGVARSFGGRWRACAPGLHLRDDD